MKRVKENIALTEEQKKEQARKISVKEGSFTSLMDGFGTRYLTPYALAVGATNSQIALLASLPHFLGNFAQLTTLKLIKKFSRKKIVITGALIQALLWLPLIAIGWLYHSNYLTTLSASICIISLYAMIVIAGSAANPAWSSWMKDILGTENGKYLSRRNEVITGVVLASLLIAGAIMRYFETFEIFIGFTILFSIAFLGRITAAYLFSKKYEPKCEYNEKSAFSLLDFVEHITQNNYGRFVIFLTIISFSTAIASPFFTVFMLKELNLDYFSFTLITISPIIATFTFLPVWGKFSDKHGNVKILKITGYLIPLVPLLWMISPTILLIGKTELIIYLFIIEIFTGFAWAGFNHGTSTFIYDAVSKEKMPYCVAYFNILTGIGVFVGSIVGGFIASASKTPFGISPILLTFAISAFLRIASAIFLTPIIKEVKPVTPFSIKESIKKHFKEEKTILTTQFWKFVGFKPLKNTPPDSH